MEQSKPIDIDHLVELLTKLYPTDDAPPPPLDRPSPETLDLAYTALADALETHAAAKIAANEAELVARQTKAQLQQAATAGCRSDAERDAAMTRCFADVDRHVLNMRHAEVRAKLEADLAQLELERTKNLWTVAGHQLY